MEVEWISDYRKRFHKPYMYGRNNIEALKKEKEKKHMAHNHFRSFSTESLLNKKKLKIVAVTILCFLVFSTTFIDVAGADPKRRRRMRRIAIDHADTNKRFTQLGLIYWDIANGNETLIEYGNKCMEIEEVSLKTARDLMKLSQSIRCELPVDYPGESPIELPIITSVVAEGLILLPANITHAPIGSCLSLYGQNFDPDPTLNTVTFNGVDTTVSLASSTWLRVATPYIPEPGPANIVVATSAGSSSPFPFTIDPLPSPPSPAGDESSEFLENYLGLLPLVKREILDVAREEPEAFIDSGVDKDELLTKIDEETSLVSDFYSNTLPTMSNEELTYMDAVILAWPPDKLAEMAAMKRELEIVIGGIAFPVDKLALLAPYIGLASTILVATAATAIYVKRRKER